VQSKEYKYNVFSAVEQLTVKCTRRVHCKRRMKRQRSKDSTVDQHKNKTAVVQKQIIGNQI